MLQTAPKRPALARDVQGLHIGSVLTTINADLEREPREGCECGLEEASSQRTYDCRMDYRRLPRE
jgi:hypothetical protein